MRPVTLITGSSGFVGKLLCEHLLARGERVRGLDVVPPDPRPPELEFAHGSVTDPAAVARAMAGVGTVLHLAAVTALWAPSPRSFAEINVGGTANVVDAARSAGVARLVHVSSYVTLIGGSRRRKAPLIEADALARASCSAPTRGPSARRRPRRSRRRASST